MLYNNCSEVNILTLKEFLDCMVNSNNKICLQFKEEHFTATNKQHLKDSLSTTYFLNNNLHLMDWVVNKFNINYKDKYIVIMLKDN